MSFLWLCNTKVYDKFDGHTVTGFISPSIIVIHIHAEFLQRNVQGCSYTLPMVQVASAKLGVTLTENNKHKIKYMRQSIIVVFLL